MDAAGSGTPQLALSPPAGRLGFDPACQGASNASGLKAGQYAATTNAILNMGAAVFSSAGAFAKDNQQ